MSNGRVEAIYITPDASGTIQSVEQAEAIANTGLAGDRYGSGNGTFSKKIKPGQHLTLIEREAVEAINRDTDVELTVEETRRNVVTSGIALNHLVGQEFTIGEVRIRGVRLCEPCAHLEKMTREGVRHALIHRGGLRADILSGGVLRVGDAIEV